MPQPSLPIFQVGQTPINDKLSYVKADGCITYFNWLMPVFIHSVDDHATFQMITAQFCAAGVVKQADVCRAFGVSGISLKRAVRLFRDQGPAGFFAARRTRGPAVLTPEIMRKAQRLLDTGKDRQDVADALGVKRNTLYKAIADERLRLVKRDPSDLTTGSERNAEDVAAPMGMATTNTVDRVLARVGKLISSVEITFAPSSDVPHGGVLCALPALIAVGLFRHAERFFTLPKGYYGLKSIFTLLAFLALLRVKSLEDLRYEAPGEWGKVLGLDRIPEVRTMRKKVAHLADQQLKEWSIELCKDWMQSDNESASALYVDGHVRVYHGHQTKLPRHHVAREKLCMRATVDYWVNAMDGQPFFFVNQAVDPGMVKVLQNEIIPNLEQLVPNQPSEEYLKENPLAHRFKVIFDREGYSPTMFKKLWETRVACFTYRKGAAEDWAAEEFHEFKVTRSSGEMISVRLAERGTFLGGEIWLREIRKLTSTGKQIGIVTTDFLSEIGKVAVTMFSRWSQENFFRYMRIHYGLDSLVTYDLEDVANTTDVVNPKYRELSGRVSKLAAQLAKKQAIYAATILAPPIEKNAVEKYEEKKNDLKDEVEQLEASLATAKLQRKEVARKIKFAELPDDEKFKKLGTKSKHFIDTIKMIAYRAETAMVNALREAMLRDDEGRKLMVSIYQATADIIPNKEAKELHVRLHHLASGAEDRSLQHLLNQLNETETIFPGTEMKIVYSMVSS